MNSKLKNPPPNQRGFTLLEVVVSTALLTILLGSVAQAVLSIQDQFDEELLEAQLQHTSRTAMDRLVRTASRALTNDATLEYLGAAGGDAWGFRFRDFAGADAAGEPVYDDDLQVFLLGDNDNLAPCAGVVLGRAPSLADVVANGCGADGVLATDDDTNVAVIAGTPASQILVHSRFAPRDGSILSFTPVADSDGRLVTITLRTNLLLPDGRYLRTDDLVLEERVALKW